MSTKAMAATAPLSRLVSPGLRHLSPRTFFPDLSSIRCANVRRFTSSPLLRAVRQQTPKPRNPAASPAKSASPAGGRAGPQTSYAFVKSLGSKTTPTTLYEAPSHFWFYFGCWSSGLGLVAWSALTGPSLIMAEDHPQWVRVTYAASYVILCTMGFYLISRTHNVVSLIRVLPGQIASETATGAPALRMEVKVKSMIPFMKPKTIRTDTNKARLRSRLALPEELVPALRRQQIEKEKEAAKELHRFDMNHLLTMPFRKMGRALTALFNGTKGAWTDMGFGKMRIEKQEFKIDVTNGFAHDGFRTLEKIVPVQ